MNKERLGLTVAWTSPFTFMLLEQFAVTSELLWSVVLLQMGIGFGIAFWGLWCAHRVRVADREQLAHVCDRIGRKCDEIGTSFEVELTQDQARLFQSIIARLNVAEREQEVVLEALALYEWVTREQSNGHEFGSYDDRTGELKVAVSSVPAQVSEIDSTGREGDAVR